MVGFANSPGLGPFDFSTWNVAYDVLEKYEREGRRACFFNLTSSFILLLSEASKMAEFTGVTTTYYHYKVDMGTFS